MSREKLPMHGAETHGRHGPDPVPGMGDIAFDVDNEGGSLEIGTSGAIPTTTDIGVQFTLSGGNDFVVDVLGGGNILLESITAGVTLSGNSVILSSPAGGLALASALLHFFLQAGSKFQVTDSGGNPIFEVRDDGSVHIKTGTAPVADL